MHVGPGPDGLGAEHGRRVGEVDGGAVGPEPRVGLGGRRPVQRGRAGCERLVGDDGRHGRLAVLLDPDGDGLERVARDRDVVRAGSLLAPNPVDAGPVEDILTDHRRLARLERLAVAGAEGRVERPRVLRHLVGRQRRVELGDAAERLRLAQAGLRVEPDLVHALELGPLAGRQVDERPRRVGLVDEVEDLPVPGRGQRPLEHGRAGTSRRPGGHHDRNRGDGRGDGPQPERQARMHPRRLPVDAGVAQHALPVAGARVRRRDRIEQLGHLGHASTSSSFVSRLARAACNVAETVPRATPRASAIAA